MSVVKLNVLSVDVEDYFHVEAFAPYVANEQWSSFTPRVERNVGRILNLFSRFGVRGTFFVLGWVARRFPHLVRDIAAAGHEVGSHGYKHKRLHVLTPDEFRRDIRDANSVLTDQVQRPIHCYRAPSFSIVRDTMWAFDILGEEGILLDSSIFPVRHGLYGFPDAARFPSWYLSKQGFRIFEFPPSTIRFATRNIGVAGGGYLRHIPYGLTHWAIRHINATQQEPAMVYFHPWEIDPDQPRVRSRYDKWVLRHYANLSTMEGKLERLLQDFRFDCLSEVCRHHRAYLAATSVTAVAESHPGTAAAHTARAH